MSLVLRRRLTNERSDLHSGYDVQKRTKVAHPRSIYYCSYLTHLRISDYSSAVLSLSTAEDPSSICADLAAVSFTTVDFLE